MLPGIIEACDEIVSFNNKIELLKAEVGRRQVSYNSEMYEGFNNQLYKKVKSESYRELQITKHFLKFLPLLRNIERIWNIEVEIKRFEYFCWYLYIDNLKNEERIKFELFAFILSEWDMIDFYTLTKKEHVNYYNLKNSYVVYIQTTTFEAVQ